MRAYLSGKADNRIIEALARQGFEINLLAPFCALTAPTDTHADMLLLSVGDKVFKHKDYPLDGEFLNITEQIGSKYPDDVLLNVCTVGRHAFCNVKYASKTVLKHLEDCNYSIHHVAQGYSHCSTLTVGDNALITADEGIAAAAREAGVDVLKIRSGHISLPPYGYGFIGGASGAIGDTVYFCGSLKYHPDGEMIGDFIFGHGKEYVELGDFPLSDIGGIMFI